MVESAAVFFFILRANGTLHEQLAGGCLKCKARRTRTSCQTDMRAVRSSQTKASDIMRQAKLTPQVLNAKSGTRPAAETKDCPWERGQGARDARGNHPEESDARSSRRNGPNTLGLTAVFCSSRSLVRTLLPNSAPGRRPSQHRE